MTGTVELLPAGSFGVDYSFGRPALADLQTIGTQFVSRYICIENDLTRGKLWTKDQLRWLADAGIFAQVNYEQGESTTLGGEAAGRRHGKVAADWRHYLEMPPDLPIVVSTDVGVTRAQYGAIEDFCHAFKEESGGPIGHYHGTALCAYLEDRGLNDLTWMAMATSWSPGGETARVHVRQKGYVLGVCDANYVRKSTPFWNYHGESLPPSQEDDMTDEERKMLVEVHAWLGELRGHFLDLAASPPQPPGYYGVTLRDAILEGTQRQLDNLPPASGGSGVTADQVVDIINGTFLTTGG